jgi:hypothetical protein
MVSKIIASLYTALALVALVLALAWIRQDPLGFVCVVVLGLPWIFFLGKIVGDSPWLGPTFAPRGTRAILHPLRRASLPTKRVNIVTLAWHIVIFTRY